jgi:hypothetical protein
MLTAFQQKLAEEYVRLGTKTDAYKAARPDWEQTAGNNIYSYACKAFTKEVMAEVERLKTIEKEAERKAAEADAEYCRKLWSKRDSVEGLLDIVRDCRRTREKAQKSGEGVPQQVALVERNTIETLNKMMGYNEPEKATVDNTITVTFGDGEEGADWAV